MKELSKIELEEVYGGGPVIKWLGKVYSHFLNLVDKQIEDTYQKVMVEGQIIAD